MKNIEIYQVDAFTQKPFNGNPAGVCFTEGLTGREMQSIAKEMNLPETAFLTKSDKADYLLRWFTPAVEVQLCGHATIASLHYLNEKGLLNGSVSFETKWSGVLKCGIKENRYFMQIPFYSLSVHEERDEILNILGLQKTDAGENTPFILAENNYLYINIKTLDALKNCSPDFKALKKYSGKYKSVQAVAVFTTETFEGNNAHLRFFAPYYGIDEDPVTGSANGPLLLVMRRLGLLPEDDRMTVKFEQGDFVGREGRIGVDFFKEKNELFISGNAVTVLKGNLIF